MKRALLPWIAATIPIAAATAAVPRSAALRPLTGDAATRLIEGELRCAFAASSGATLLLAGANVGRVSRPVAAVRFHLLPVRLPARITGGFDALTRGGIFRGSGITATVIRGARLRTRGEDTRYRATLRIARGGATRLYRGTWNCGP